jgi:ATP-dependent DNA helicase RecG
MHITEVPAKESQALLQLLISRAEARNLEFKRVSGKMVHKALETLCAFANTEGGILVLGIADLKEFQGPSRIFGVNENPEAFDELQRKLLTEIQPSLADVRVQRLPTLLHNGACKGQQGYVVMVSMARSQRVHSIVGGGT